MDLPDLFSLSTLSLFALLILMVLWYFGTLNHSYFKDRNVPYMKPLPFIGNSLSLFNKNKSIGDLMIDQYQSGSGHRCFGFFQFTKPIYMLREPELIKTIGVKEFDHFMNRQSPIDESVDPLFGKALLSLKDKRWKDMRAILSPAFTSSKMKNMFILISEIGEQLSDHLDRIINEHSDSEEPMSMEMKDFFRRFATDVIATTAFGLKVDSLKEPENEFYLIGKDATNFSAFRVFLFLLNTVFPKLMKVLRVPVFDKKNNIFFRRWIQHAISTREKDGIVRPDMIHLLMQARKGELKADEGEEEIISGVHNEARGKLEDDDIAAQASGFFLAGLETVSTVLSFATSLLAVHPVYREKVQQEIDSIMEETGNKLSYESIQKMKYLDMFVSETLRMYPPMPTFDRICVSPVTIPGTDNDPPLTFQKGDAVIIPTYSIHHDPESFPDPETFDPERFGDDNKHNIKPFSYVPFGVGPRFCIAQRFALMEVKIALVHLLSRADPCVVKKTCVPLELDKKGFNMNLAGGFWVGFKRRNSPKISTC